jgi:hypothetical protein
MKNLLLASAVSLPLLLAGCGSTGNKVISLLPQEVQTLVINSCSIAISLEAATTLLSLFVPQAETIQQMVNNFCEAILPPTATRARLVGSSVKGTFRGVTFYGKVAAN